jgi:regulator of cell morphogenesis and NO signaling
VTHSRHEEEIIFPYIRQIESTHRRKETYGNLFVRTLRKPLSNIEKEHDVIMSILKEIKTLTNDYSCPADASADLSAIYHKLEEFHSDMLQHTHLEDDSCCNSKPKFAKIFSCRFHCHNFRVSRRL